LPEKGKRDRVEEEVSQGAPAFQNIGRYRLLGELGRGAMGVVYRAEDPNIGRTVALKTQRLDIQGEEQQELLRRLRQEARSVGVLNHPNIVTIYDAGEQAELFYIAMEYIEGRTLQSMLTPGRAMPTDLVIDIIRQICAGLDYAHARQIVHRDIKPANIMITPEGTAKIMDFGIAKVGSGMTSAGQVLGTPSYMSPEQVRGKPLDGRSDLFSVGVILYETITGQKPFTGDTITTIIYKIVNEEPIPPRDIELTVHPGLAQVMTRALCKNLDQRYQRGWDLARDLMNYKSLSGGVAVLADSSDETMALSTAQLRAQAALAAADAREAMEASAARAAESATPESGQVASAQVASVARSAKTPAVPERAQTAAATQPPMSTTSKVLVAAVALLLIIVGIESRAVWKARQNAAQAAASEHAATSVPPVNTPPKPSPDNPATIPATTPAAPAPDGTAAASSPKTDASASAKKRASKSSPKEVVAADTTTVIPPPTPAATTGQLRVLSVPLGAEVNVDGKAVGTTPITLQDVAPGAHAVSVTKSGYRSETRNVEVERGKRAQVSASLVSSMATVAVNSTPTGAAILIDGSETGKVTPAQVPVAEGAHKLVLKLEGWHSAESGSFTLKPGETYHFSPILSKDTGKLGFFKKVFGGDPANKGTLTIRTQPSGATVIVDGNTYDKQTPISRLLVEPGKHHVTIKHQGYKTMERDITIEKGKVIDLSGPLEKQ